MGVKINMFFRILLGVIFSIMVSQAAVITMEVNNTNSQPGEEIRYTISLDYDGNNGLLSNTEVNNTIPAGTTYVGGTVEPAAAQYPADGSTGETIIWRLGSSAPGIVGESGGGTSISKNVADTFGGEDATPAYNRNDGSIDWSGDWIEENDDGSPTSGDIQIDDGELDLEANKNNAGPSIYREVDLSNANVDSVEFSVELYHNYLDRRKDKVYIEASNDDGANYSILETIDQNTAEKQTFTYNLGNELGSVGAQTRIRFRVDTHSNGNERVEFNDVDISWTEASTGAHTTVELIPSTLLKTIDGTETMTVTMEISSSEDDTVTPSALMISGFDGAHATCDEPPAAQSITAGNSIDFVYNCTLTAGSGQGTIKFSADASGTNTYALGTSPTVIIVPPLTFVVTADDPALDDPIVNNAWISSYKPLTSDECYAISDETDTIYHLDLENATATALTSATGVTEIEALKFNLDYSQLYAINAEADGNNAAELGTIDQVSGLFTPVGDYIGTITGTYEGGTVTYTVHDADAMTFDPTNGELYAAVRRSGGNDMLIKLDPASGAHIADAFGSGEDFLEIDSGITDIDDIDGMSFYPDGTLYAIQNNGGEDDYLMIIDKVTGATSTIGRVQDETGISINDLESLSFMPDGTLYAANGASTGNGVLFSIDRTNATMLNKGTIPEGGDYEGLSCREADSNLNEVIINEISNTTETTLPVTIAYVYPQLYDDSLELNFRTDTETNNIGFNIYAIKGKKWIKLNDELILGAMNSFLPLDYHTSLILPEDMKIKTIGIAGVDVNGAEERHGPFDIGKESGSKTEIIPIDWKQINAEVKAYKQVRKATRTTNRQTTGASKESTRAIFKNQVINLQVKENAVYHITHEELLANDINLIDFKSNKIAISHKGEAIERHIAETNKRGKWTSESYLEFKGEKPQGKDALYLKANNYRLSLNKKLALASEGIEPTTRKELISENNKLYGMTSPGDDPFFDKLLYVRASGQSAEVTRTFELNEIPQGDVKMTVYVGAYSNTTHHLQVTLNGTPVADMRSEAGWRDMPIEVIIDDNMLQEGSNTMTLSVIGESDAFDVYTYDKLVISYDTEEAQESQTVVLSLNDKVSEKSIKPARGVDYLIISHPMFMTETLTSYISQKEGEGWNTHLVSVEDIYDAYGYGMATPEAIKSYLKVAKQRGVTHVQLVGSASYDYLDTLGIGSVSFIGSLYVKTGAMTRYTPCDACLVTDDTGMPQMAIGRWPVRTLQGLETVVNKSLSWRDSGQSQAHSALFIADKKDEASSLVFGRQQDTLFGQFQAIGLWDDITKVYLDDYIASNSGDETVALATARTQIQQSLSNGASITSYSGHSSLSTWSFAGMLKQGDIASISNEDRTTIALPLACYTTYADSPRTTTLAHQFLAAGDNGAVAIYGAASLSDFAENQLSATKVINYLLRGETIGEAVRKAKVDLGVDHIDVIRNSNLLGDVTIGLD